MNDGCQVIQGQVQDECQGMKLGLSCAGSGIRAHGIRMDAKAQVQEKRMKTEGSKLDDLNKGKRSASRMKMF